MSEESSVPKIIVIVTAIISLLYGLVSLCGGGFGLVGSASGIALFEGDMQIMAIVSLGFTVLNLLAMLFLVIGGVVALINRSKGRLVLAAALVVVLLTAWVLFLGNIGVTAVFSGTPILSLVIGSVLGLVLLVVKSVFYLAFAALLIFLGKGA